MSGGTTGYNLRQHNLRVGNEDVSSSNPVPTEQGVIDGRTKKYEDADFTSGESPITLDVNTDLGKNGVDGYITCDGPGNILVEISDNGTDFGDQHTLKIEEVIDLRNINVDKIKITHSGTDSAYRIMVV